MTSHLNINWGAVGDANRREFDTNAKWSLQHCPNSKLSRGVFSTLAKPFKDPARATLHRAEVERTSPSMAAAGSAARYAMEAGADASGRGHSTQPQTLTGTTPREKLRPGSSPALELAATGSSGGGSGQRRVVHCHRKHRRDCPKHLLHEIQRRNAAIERSEVPPFSPVLDEDCALQDRPEVSTRATPGEREQAVLQLLPAPNHVGQWGHGLANFLTGVYNEKACKWERRMVTEHPDFARLDMAIDQRNACHHTVRHKAKKDKEEQKKKQKKRAGDAQHAANAAVVHINELTPKEQLRLLEKEIRRGEPLIGPTKLLRDEHDWSHHRQKYDMKTHMERMRLMGTALLRK